MALDSLPMSLLNSEEPNPITPANQHPTTSTSQQDSDILPCIAQESPLSEFNTPPYIGDKHQRRTQGIERNAKKRQEKKEQQHSEKMQRVLRYLETEDVKIGELLEYISSPKQSDRMLQYRHLFQIRGQVSQILTWWISPHNSYLGRSEVHEWAIDHTAKTVAREAETIRKKGVLRTKAISSESTLSFSFSALYQDLRDIYAKTATRIFDAMSRSARQVRQGISNACMRTKQIVIVSSMVSLLSEHSRQNNVLKRLFGLFLYASGAQRQVISVINHVGLSESYTALTSKVPPASTTGKNSKLNIKTRQRRTPGTLIQLSDSMRTKAREVAAKITFGQVYDNINFAEKVAEQIIGRTTSIESGICATIWPLHEASTDDMKLDQFHKSFLEAGPLRYQNIQYTTQEAQQFQLYLQHCVLRIIVNHGGEGFQKFRAKLNETLPKTPQKISLHTTPLHPLPTMKIDESTIIGNAEVDEAIVKELQLATEKITHVRFIAGNQLSINRLRSLTNIRTGHVGGYHGFGWGVWIPGLFHAKMADMHGIFVTHWGKPQSGTRNPGSLNFHNTLLRHLPITITSLPTFRTCRDLVFVSLYARVLTCLLQVSGHATLEAYCENVADWDQLEGHAKRILDEYASPVRCHAMCDQRDTEGLGHGDMVFENAILFLRDALISREFTDSVKSGDSGRVMLVLKMWTYGFRGNGRSKYVYEMLMFVHNCCNVWPTKITDIVLNNWLLNPSGKENGFVEVDLVQEHLNFWIKSFYKAHGSNSSWEWLEIISPCVDALRRLASSMKRVLGSNIGNRHAPPDLSQDIAVLMKSLREHSVYVEVKGRQLDDDDAPAVDVISEGMTNLFSSNALEDFNKAFRALQEQMLINPIVGDKEGYDLPDEPVSPSRPTTPNLESTSDTNISDNLNAPVSDLVDVQADDDDEILDYEDSINDIEEGETLQLLTLADVALEMDMAEVEEDGDREDDLGDDEESTFGYLFDCFINEA